MEARYSHDDACARNQAMLIYLILTSLILVGSSAHCFLVDAEIFIGIYAIVPIILSSSKYANFTEDGPRGNV